MFSLYCAWRFRGVDPFVALHGPGGGSPYHARREAVLQSFAEHAGEMESSAGMAVQALGTVSG